MAGTANFSKPSIVVTRGTVNSLDPIRRAIAEIMEKTGEIRVLEDGEAV